MLAIRSRNDIDIHEVLLNIGYGSDYQPSARIDSLISDYVENVHFLIDPSYSYVIRDIGLVQGSSGVIGGSVIFQSEVVARLLEQCDEVAVFLVPPSSPRIQPAAGRWRSRSARRLINSTWVCR